MRATEIEISLDEISRNACLIRQAIPGRVKMLGVVKADAYGHGDVQVARCLVEQGADMLATAIDEEALALRDAGIACPILVLGRTDFQNREACVERDISMAVFSPEELQSLDAIAQRMGKRALCHLKYDTGMTRIGVRGEAELRALLETWTKCKSVRMEGFFTHFCAADSDPDFTRQQNVRFVRAVAMARQAGFSPIAHAAASSAMLREEYQHDMIRAGIALYGSCMPDLPVRNAQTLRTRPVRMVRVAPGDTVGYGRTYRFQRDSVVITLPIGYGDGYPRVLGNKADVLVRGMRAPVVGNVCMDMLTVDVTGIPGVTLEDEVVLLGRQGEQRITPDELARLAGTIPYEIMLGFSPRVRRIYRGG